MHEIRIPTIAVLLTQSHRTGLSLVACVGHTNSAGVAVYGGAKAKGCRCVISKVLLNDGTVSLQRLKNLVTLNIFTMATFVLFPAGLGDVISWGVSTGQGKAP